MAKVETSQEKSKLSPAMQRYMEIKNQHPDYLIFYRMGDFYELFFDDAKLASEALGIALTHRGKTEDSKIPMCGVPFHAYENYLPKLINQGFKVAICEQTETPEEAKKRGSGAVLNREVVRLVTSGTLTEDYCLNARKNNYLLCCVLRSDHYGFAWVDLSTADFYTQYLKTSESTMAADFLSVLSRLDPAEILVSDSMLQTPQLFQVMNAYHDRLTPIPQARFNSLNAHKTLQDLFKVAALDAFGSFSRTEITASGVMLDYVIMTQKGKMPQLKFPVKFNDLSCVEIDSATRSNLELNTSAQGGTKMSLLKIIDRTLTGPGARLLSVRLNCPSRDIIEINQRLDAVNFFLEIPEIRKQLREVLESTSDLKRSLSKLTYDRGGPRDIAAIGRTLDLIPRIKNLISSYGRYNKQLINGLPLSLKKRLERFGEFGNLVVNISEALIDEVDLPMNTRDGGFIREGYSATLDMLRQSKLNGQVSIKDLEAQYIKETGLSALKIRYNNILGFFIEVPSKFTKDILQNPIFVHRQSVLNATRFTTAALSELEQQDAHTSEKTIALEIELYKALVENIVALSQEISETADILAELDVDAALADLAESEGYVRPVIDDSTVFEVKDGRHPVVEAALKKSHEGSFISNDCSLDTDRDRIWLLTGPNMAGKSTFLRQNAVIAIMAQMGSFVPCSYARIGIIDKIFSRVGASDDLSRGRSTFMVEMVETATILNQATARSFVILDEIGRGTATYDGLSIAWSVIEHLHEINACRTLFATHYHELTVLASKLKTLTLHCMKIKEYKDDIIFMHEVIDGAADRSYGIHVAKLAGIPNLVLKRAEQILKSLEQNPNNKQITSIENDLPLFAAFKVKNEKEETKSPLLEALEALNPDDFSPREALEKLYALKKLAENQS